LVLVAQVQHLQQPKAQMEEIPFSLPLLPLVAVEVAQQELPHLLF
jgi:hypothetical protein